MRLSEAKRKKIKEWLPSGTSAKIAKDLNITRQAVCNYFSCGRSKEIEAALIEEIKARIHMYIIEKVIDELFEDNR